MFQIFLSGEAYTKIIYPAGELQVRLTEATQAKLAEVEDISVIARITTADQVVELCLLWDALQEAANDTAKRRLILPYLPFARADRRFVEGDCFGLGVFAQLINTLQAQVVTLDAHSAVAKNEIHDLTDISALPFISQAMRKFAHGQNAGSITVLFPDDGARKRYKLPAVIEDTNITILNCSKKRDPATGKFIGFHVPNIDEFPKQTPVIIVDDICDGGGTFNGIADALKDYELTLGLYVTHGIFSKGMSALNDRFHSIYTTDSFAERNDSARLEIIAAVESLWRPMALA